jgi:hypothetical protein
MLATIRSATTSQKIRLRAVALCVLAIASIAMVGCAGLVQSAGTTKSGSVTSAPTITSINPTSGAIGSSVTITGTNLGASQGTSTVTFNGIAATPASWTATSVVVPVPAGATTGNIVVTVGGVASNGVSFAVTASSPSITGLNPTSGLTGTSVTITGTNFGATQGTSTVKFNGTTATPTTWTATSIAVPVPAGATTGNIVVTVGGVASNGVSFAVTASGPSITGLNPTSGLTGTSVTITGTNFGATQGTSTIKFNGTTATPTNWTAASIVVPVPAGATTGNVVVTAGGVTSNGVNFTVTVPAPSITSLNPNAGFLGTVVTITGANFGATKGTSTIKFNGTTGTPTSWSATSIVVPAPTGATTGSVVVTVGGVASNGLTFTVQADTTSPTVPAGLTATAASSSQINLSWTASTDNVGVAGYKVFRGGTQVGTSAATSYSDSGLAASTSYTYTVAANDAAGNTSAQSAGASATTLAASSGGQIPSTLGWYQIPNTSIKSLCPSYSDIQASSGCAAVMSAWSGALFDTKRNRLIIHGGGHSDYYGNEIYAIDFNTNPISAVLVKDASHGSAITNVTSTPEAFNDGTPNARHTYNGWVYLPTQDSYLLYGAGLSADGPFSDGQWLFNASNLTWTQQQPATHPNTAKTGSIPQHAYDPVTDTVYFVEGNASQFWQLQPATGQWTSLGSSGSACGNDNATSSIDPVRRLYACVGNGELFTVSLNSPFTVTNDTSAPGCATLAGTNSPGFAYDPIQQLFVGWAGGNTAFTYNPASHSCTAITSYSGGPTTIQPNGTFGRFRYAPALGVFVVINDINSNAYSLRLSPVSGGTGGPTITNVTVSAVTTSGASVGWTTDVAATSQVEYGLTTAYGTLTTLNSSLVTSHSQPVAGLVANTLYHYRVRSKNSSGVESISGDAAFTTNNTTDTTAPTVSITSPAASASLAGTVSVTANASDNVAVASVQFLLDGANLGAPDITAPYAISWDTTTVVNGAHTLSARATDTSGNIGNAAGVAVNVTNSATASNFQALCTAPGVVTCVTWDSPSAFTPATGGGGYASGLYPAEDGTYQGIQDTTNRVDGAGALEFVIRPGSVHPHGTNPAGYWFQQFGTDGSPTHFGEGTTLYLQFRFMVSPTMLNYDWTQAGGEGWKVFIVFGPVPGQSCTSDQFVQENTNQTNVATGYVSCGTPGLYSNGGSPPMNIEQGDYNCAYAGGGATYTGPTCFVYPASTWITEYWVVHIGTFGQPNSSFQAWIAPEGQPLKQFINLPNFNFGDGSDHTVGLNAIELTPYFSGANGSTTTPGASMWFDDLIISTQPIAAPTN